MYKVCVNEYEYGQYDLGPFETLKEAVKARNEHNEEHKPWCSYDIKISYEKTITRTFWKVVEGYDNGTYWREKNKR